MDKALEILLVVVVAIGIKEWFMGTGLANAIFG